MKKAALSKLEEKLSRTLNEMEERFCQAFVSEAPGDAAWAADIAGYVDTSQSGFELLRRPAVQTRIRSLLAVRFKIAANPSKLALIDRLWGIVMGEENAFAVAKNADTLAKIMGWFAPTHRINENIAGGERGSFQSLLQTLRENGEAFSIDQKKMLLEELLKEQGALAEAIQMLSVTNGAIN